MLTALPRPSEPSVTLSIKGLVIDETGPAVPDATVTVLRKSDPLSSETSNADGQFQFRQLNLKLGIHTLQAVKAGRKTEKQELFVNKESRRAVNYRKTAGGWQAAGYADYP